MFQRIAIVFVVFFWLMMNGALIRLYLHPESSEILTIPVEHVAKQVFLHEQQSNLTIFQSGQRVGGVVIRPHRQDAKGLRLVDFSGTLTVHLPLVTSQRIAWHGEVQMDRAFALKDMDLHLVSQDPSLATDVHLQPDKHLASYSVKQGDQTVTESSMTLDQAGAQSLVQSLGIEPNVLSQVNAVAVQSANAFRVSAREGQLLIHGERTDVFHIVIRQSESPIVEADISQLGQVLAIKTALGYSLAPEDLSP